MHLYSTSDDNKITGSLPTALANLSTLKKISFCKCFVFNFFINFFLNQFSQIYRQ